MSELKLSNEDRTINQPMEKMVATYDAYMRKMTFGRESILRDKSVEMALIKPGEDVLEIGCGTGSLTIAAKKKTGLSGRVVGIDVIPDMVEYSQQKAVQANMDITFQLGTINDLPFSDHSYDIVLCSFMIFHMSEKTRQEGIAEIHRVLKPQGRLLIVDLAMPTHPLQKAIANWIIFRGGLEHDLHELIPFMETSGFSDIECAPVKFSIFGISLISYLRGNA